MTISNYSNPNDHYTKTSQVALAASINQNGGGFALTQDYVIGLITAPVAIAVLGILACFFFNWGLFFRCCCTFCKCLPRVNKDAEPEQKKISVAWQRMLVFISFYAFVLFALVADTISFAGNSSVIAGVGDLTSVLDGIGGIFASLTTQSNGKQCSYRYTMVLHCHQTLRRHLYTHWTLILTFSPPPSSPSPVCVRRHGGLGHLPANPPHQHQRNLQVLQPVSTLSPTQPIYSMLFHSIDNP